MDEQVEQEYQSDGRGSEASRTVSLRGGGRVKTRGMRVGVVFEVVIVGIEVLEEVKWKYSCFGITTRLFDLQVDVTKEPANGR